MTSGLNSGWTIQKKIIFHGLQRNGRNVIGLFPGASHREKRWESHNYGELAKRLGQQQIYVIFGSSEDRELAKQAALFIKANCENAEILDFTDNRRFEPW